MLHYILIHSRSDFNTNNSLWYSTKWKVIIIELFCLFPNVIEKYCKNLFEVTFIAFYKILRSNNWNLIITSSFLSKDILIFFLIFFHLNTLSFMQRYTYLNFFHSSTLFLQQVKEQQQGNSSTIYFPCVWHYITFHR